MAEAAQNLAVAEILAAAFEVLPKPIIVSDYRVVILANAAMRALLHVEDRSDIEGVEAITLLHPDVREAVLERKRLLLAGASGFHDVPIKLLASDGTTVHARVTVTPIEHGDTQFAVLLYEPTA